MEKSENDHNKPSPEGENSGRHRTIESGQSTGNNDLADTGEPGSQKHTEPEKPTGDQKATDTGEPGSQKHTEPGKPTGDQKAADTGEPGSRQAGEARNPGAGHQVGETAKSAGNRQADESSETSSNQSASKTGVTSSQQPADTGEPTTTLANFISGLRANLRVRQAFTLYAASFAGIPLGIVTSIIFTRFLGPQGYGDFAFLDTLFDFARAIFPLGFFYAGNRALVLNDNPRTAREYYGAGLAYLFIVFLLMVVVMGAYGLLDPNLADKGLTRFYFYLLPFGWIFLLGPYFDNMLHPDNRIHELAAVRFFPKIITFAAALAIWFLLRDFQGNRLAIVWPAYLLAFLTVYTMVFSRIRISFRNLRARMQTIWAHNRRYGIHLHIGHLFSNGAIALTGILISYFSPDNRGVGFFFLALAISRPLALVPGVIAATWFKDFARQQRASRQLTGFTILLSLTAFAALLLLAGPFIRLVYTDEFLPVINLVYLCGTAMLLHGIATFYNRFLEAHGHGKIVRNVFIATGLSLLVVNLLLIPSYGVHGAAIAMIISSVVYLSGCVWGYVRVVG